MSGAVKVWTSLVGLLSILGIVFTLSFMINGGANEGFEEYPVVTNLHVYPSLFYLLLAPLQFLATVRTRYRTFHRWSGRLLVVIGLVLGGAGLFMALVFPFSGFAEQVVVGGFAVFFLVSVVIGAQSARKRKFSKHREWMIRAFAIGLSIVTMRLLFIPLLVITGAPTRADTEFYSILTFSIAFVIHSLAAECWIRYTRKAASKSAISASALQT